MNDTAGYKMPRTRDSRKSVCNAFLRTTPGIKTKSSVQVLFFEKQGIVADISFHVDYGYNVPSLAFRIQQSIKHNVESMTKYKVDKVDVHIQDVNFPENAII